MSQVPLQPCYDREYITLYLLTAPSLTHVFVSVGAAARDELLC